MKRKMLTKLISVVCALALTASCVVMSVGAVPPKGQAEQTEQTVIDWEQEKNSLNNLIATAEQIKNNGYAKNQCSNLANAVENFLNGAACHKIVEDTNDGIGKIAIFGGFYLHRDQLRSNSLEMRKKGVRGIIDFTPMIIELIQGRYLNN